jgi:hypothetical protein
MFCYISHGVMGFVLYGIQNYAAINMANLTLRITRCVIGAGKHVHYRSVLHCKPVFVDWCQLI